ncbi:MAG TPA: aminopeptidase P family protein [Xanthobacteraceae bacterium]|jgi:Xaa-Pro aminopeptidase|nr:aminopeptidase P family protein [Xanthobacteraceae bacterium]
MFEAHFQSFEDRGERANSAPRLAALRAELKRRGLDGFVVPRADRYQNEYVPPCAERLAWLTGFTGSAGAAIVLADRAVLFVDGRYTVQAGDEVDTALFAIAHLVERPPAAWIEEHLPAGAKLGYSPWLHTVDGAERLGKACEVAKASLVAVADNPIDACWSGRPAPPLGAVALHDLRYAGEDAAAKLSRLRAEIQKLGADALVVSDPHAVCWLFNIRGSDVPHTPVALAFATVPKDGRPALHVDSRKLDNDVRRSLEELAEARAPHDFERELVALGKAGRAVRLDPAACPEAIARLVGDNGGKVLRGSDPIAPMKAVKNPTEIAGARAAQLRDGAAVAQFLAWFDREAPRGQLSEIDAVEALESFRRDTGLLKDISFPTIAGAGADGAIVHYRVSRKSNRRIVPGELFLIDSGGQYEDGTTDITRTIAVGTPSAEMRRNFTLVLKGHIAIARAVFPDGTTGAQLDTLARQFLWRAGLDFDHGTGHGVGSYLSVHEGPARISKLGSAPLKRGMILSNEPGYYRNGAYGIRIENLVLVTEAAAVAGAEKQLNSFETLTLAPIDLRLVEAKLLTPDEIGWLAAYHVRVRETLAPLVDVPTREWLSAATTRLAPA